MSTERNRLLSLIRHAEQRMEIGDTQDGTFDALVKQALVEDARDADLLSPEERDRLVTVTEYWSLVRGQAALDWIAGALSGGEAV